MISLISNFEEIQELVENSITPIVFSRIKFKKILSMLVVSTLFFGFVILYDLQIASALSPVADLTGTWSGFAVVQNVEGTCTFTGKVNAHIQQNGNQIVGDYSYVGTSAKPSSPDYSCYDFNYSEKISGTLDGSRILLYSDSGTFSGSYASSGISLSIQSDELVGSVKLSPTNFTPPAFESRNKQPDVNEMIKAGVSYLNEKQFDKALDYFAKITKTDPNNVMGWMGKGVSYVGLKNYDQAITHFKKSLELSPNNKDVLQWLGRAYYLKNDCKTAANYYSIALNQDQQNSKILAEKKIVDACVAKQTVKTEPTKKAEDSKKKVENTKQKEEKTSSDTKPGKIEPPTPSVFKVSAETKPFFKALWDSKCDILSHQWELLTTKSGSLPIVCTGGTIALKSGEIIQINVGDDWDVKLLKWGGQGLAADYISTTIPPVGALMKIFETATSPIENIKTLNLAITKGETEILGGVIKIKAYCGTGNCKLLKTEEEGGGFKLYDIPSSYDSQTKSLLATINHNSVYILVEYAPAKTQDKTQTSKSLLYENKQYGFSIKYPSNWQKQETLQKDPNSSFVSIVSFTPTPNTGYGIGFSANNKDYKGLSEQKFLAKMKKQASDACLAGKSSGTVCSEITTSTDTHKNGYTIYAIYYSATISTKQGTSNVVEMTAYIPDGNDIWSLQMVSTMPNELEQIGKNMGDSLDTFKIYDYDGVKSSKTTQKQTTNSKNK